MLDQWQRCGAAAVVAVAAAVVVPEGKGFCSGMVLSHECCSGQEENLVAQQGWIAAARVEENDAAVDLDYW